jgi:L-asparaginase
VKKILLIHTGGTIGMVPSVDGLTSGNGVLEMALDALNLTDMTVELHSFEPLVDSAEVGPEHWNKIIDLISALSAANENRDPVRGVIVTHGTDTMAFTGAALSQALPELKMPVILCGSMHPLNMGGDAEENLTLALEASVSEKSGVWLAFAGMVLPAAGLVKHHSHATDAFRSVPQDLSATPKIRKFSNLRLAILTLSAGMPAAAITAALGELDGAVLRVFGAGTAMSNPDLMTEISAVIKRGVRIRAVSQCEQGGLDIGAYAAGAALWEAGVENGGAETPEVALTRLWLEMSDSQPIVCE